MKKFYITTTLPYVNDKPHMGHALEFVQADIIARYHRLLGEEVVFNVGTDEHGTKIYRKAVEQGKDTQAYVDEYAGKFMELKAVLNLSYTNFIRTTDPAHKAAAQEFWKICDKNGDIYKKKYSVRYCVGCELEKTDSELTDGKCPIHPNLNIESIDEDNYFFRWSRYQERLIDFYAKNPDFVIPDFRFKEIKKFVEGGLQDFSVSRLKEKMPWGVPVPGDDSQVMFVWFDALINYISTLGWPKDMKKFEDFWGTKENRNAVQIAGKDNLRQQSAMWQGMLLSAGLPLSKHIIIHGFILSGGQKMSKSLGNVIDSLEIVEKYGTDAFRYWVAKEANTFEDSDFTWEKFKESYNANLANGIGNLASRIIKMAINYGVPAPVVTNSRELANGHLDKFEIQKAANEIWARISELDRMVQETEPFKVFKTNPDKARNDVVMLLEGLHSIAVSLQPFLPETAEKILAALRGGKIKEIGSLFPRVE